MKDQFTINSDASLVAFKHYAEQLYNEHKYITFSAPRIGIDRSLDQNALFHLWCSEYAAYCTSINKKEVSPGLLAGMKRIVKKKFLAANPNFWGWMVHEVINPFTSESKKDYTSSASWKTGEMFMVLTWMQMAAAEDGLILESKGRFRQLQNKHNGG